MTFDLFDIIGIEDTDTGMDNGDNVGKVNNADDRVKSLRKHCNVINTM